VLSVLFVYQVLRLVFSKPVGNESAAKELLHKALLEKVDKK
jgi:hypothetical protein